MNTTKSNPTNKEQDEAFDCALQLSTLSIVPIVLGTTIELGLLDIIAKAGAISASKLASHLPTKNKDAAAMLESMLKLLATHSIVTCSTSNREGSGEEVETLYSLTLTGEYFLQDEGCGRSNSLSTFFKFNNDPKLNQHWCHIKDTILEGGCAFERAYGMPLYQFHDANPNHANDFYKGISALVNTVMAKILKEYKGFEGIKSLVDVGGGDGTTLHSIISKYPSIKGINFDQPHVVKTAPIYNGIEHIGGDMFVTIPKSEAIILKGVCHNWDDEHCLKILKKCFEALPKGGKVILIEAIIQSVPSTSITDKEISQLDNIMLVTFKTKERTLSQFEAWSKAVGFSKIQFCCSAYIDSVVEIFK